MRDITAFAEALVQDGIIKLPGDGRRSLPFPNPAKALLPPLSEEELERALVQLSGWEPWRERLMLEYPHERRELRRQLRFDGFTSAMNFMHEASRPFKAEKHHPRWSNAMEHRYYPAYHMGCWQSNYQQGRRSCHKTKRAD
jgi:pterin-4a-carbinolamine dehydratase